MIVYLNAKKNFKIGPYYAYKYWPKLDNMKYGL